MDSPDSGNAVSRLVSILKRVTRFVQVVPFVYLALYGLVLLTDSAGWCIPAGVIDSVMYVSPVVAAGVFPLSMVLRLCNWHKAACLMPYASRLENIVDQYIYQFSGQEAAIINAALAAAVIIFLIICNRHFYGRKRNAV